MNCDQVFDVLTQGPFPRGRADDSQVEAHLAGCDECRRLALALRPAVTLFHETLSENEAACLPGYWGDLLEGQPAAAPRRAASAGCDSILPTDLFAAGADPASTNDPAASEDPLHADRRTALSVRGAFGPMGIGVRAGRNRLLRRTLAAVCLAAAGGAAFLPTMPSGENGKSPLASRTPRFTEPAPRVVEGDLLWAAAGVPSCAATAPSEGFAFVDVGADGPGAPLAAWRPQTVAFQGVRARVRLAPPPRAVIFAALSAPQAAPSVHPGHPRPHRDAALLALYCCTHCHKESSPALLMAAAPAPAANVERAQACLLCHDSEP